MNVSPDRVVELVREGLAPSIAGDPATLDFALRLAREIVVYGERGLPRALFAKPSGRAVAAMVCEDFEGAAVAATKLPGRCVEFARGWGLVSFVLAVQHPEQSFETVESDRERQWFLRRLCALFGVRNLVVHDADEAAFVEGATTSYDVVVVKSRGPVEALVLVAPLLSARGQMLSFQTSDRSAELRRPHGDPRTHTLRLERTVALASAPARGRVLLCAGAVARELDAAQPTA